MKKLFVIALFFLVFSLFSLFGIRDVQAVTPCDSIFNTKPFWGSNPSQTVSADKGSRVALTFEGEDGCAGMSALFGVYTINNPNAEWPVTSTLNLGSAVPNKPGKFFLSGSWTIDLNPGTYGLTLKKVGNNLFGGVGISPNQLIVKTTQSCNISKVYATPAGGKPGDSVQLTVETQGSCQGWTASLNVVNVDPGTPASRLTPFRGSPQDVSSGKAVWGWTFPGVTSGRQRDNYQASANLGSQIDVRSSTFSVSSDSGGTCNNNGTCETNLGESSATCRDCPVTPGQDQMFNFSIPNPLQATNIIDLIDVIATWLLNISIPIAVAMIVYAGITFLISRGDTGKVTQAKNILLYTVIGLAIILIGKGFITLIVSILNLGAPTP